MTLTFLKSLEACLLDSTDLSDILNIIKVRLPTQRNSVIDLDELNNGESSPFSSVGMRSDAGGRSKRSNSKNSRKSIISNQVKTIYAKYVYGKEL